MWPMEELSTLHYTVAALNGYLNGPYAALTAAVIGGGHAYYRFGANTAAIEGGLLLAAGLLARSLRRCLNRAGSDPYLIWGVYGIAATAVSYSSALLRGGYRPDNTLLFSLLHLPLLFLYIRWLSWLTQYRLKKVLLDTVEKAGLTYHAIYDGDNELVHTNLSTPQDEPLLRLLAAPLPATADSLPGLPPVQRVINTGKPFRSEHTVRLGEEEKQFVLQVFPFRSLQHPGGALAVFYDSSGEFVSRQQRLPAEGESKRRYTLSEAMRVPALDIIFLFKPNYHLVYCSLAGAEILGHSRSEVIGRSLPELVTRPELTEQFQDNLAEAFRNGQPVFGQTWFPTVNGLRYYEYVLQPSGGSGSTTDTVMATLKDITPHKQAEEALRLSEERFFKAFNASPSLMSICTGDEYRYIYVNDTWVKTFGIRREEVIGRTTAEIGMFVEAADSTAPALNESEPVHNVGVCFRAGTGEIKYGLLSRQVINVNGGECILDVMADITERKKMEREMADLERLNLVGQMAAGIGHEIRNPMTTVRGFLQLLREREECAPYQEYFSLMIEELDRANAIISEFLSLAKDKRANQQPSDLNRVIRTLLPLIESDARLQNSTLETELASLPEVCLEEKEIRQLILNLCRNAIEAMSEGGMLQIRTYCQDEQVIFSVRDQGKGIPPDVIERIGTPFLTTKEKGTGLGLAVCYSIAARHNAQINFTTGPEGTTFYVVFPAIPPNRGANEAAGSN